MNPVIDLSGHMVNNHVTVINQIDGVLRENSLPYIMHGILLGVESIGSFYIVMIWPCKRIKKYNYIILINCALTKLQNI